MEQLLPLLYFISQSASRPVLSQNHQHPYLRTSAATNPRSSILLASYFEHPEGLMTNFKMGHFHSIIHMKNKPLHSFTHSANIFKSLLTRLLQVSLWSPINLSLACWLNHSREWLRKTGAVVVIVLSCVI